MLRYTIRQHKNKKQLPWQKIFSSQLPIIYDSSSRNFIGKTNEHYAPQYNKRTGGLLFFIQKRIKNVLAFSAFILFSTTAFSNQYTLDQWADAIFLAEGGTSATYLYGIRSVSYADESEARQICKRTVYNTLSQHREERCKDGEPDINCLARRYCPINSDTDNGTCKHWKTNVQHFLQGGRK